MWHKHTDTAYFRKDMAYAGKNHLDNTRNKGFIALSPTGFDQIRGFKSIKSAMAGADKRWPLNHK